MNEGLNKLETGSPAPPFTSWLALGQLQQLLGEALRGHSCPRKVTGRLLE